MEIEEKQIKLYVHKICFGKCCNTFTFARKLSVEDLIDHIVFNIYDVKILSESAVLYKSVEDIGNGQYSLSYWFEINDKEVVEELEAFNDLMFSEDKDIKNKLKAVLQKHYVEED